jgi:hypothetical protein
VQEQEAIARVFCSSLERFSNTRAVLRPVQGVFFLRKKTLDIWFSLYSNGENA